MADAVTLIILGASGDLTHRLLLPGLGTLLKAQPSRRFRTSSTVAAPPRGRRGDRFRQVR